MDNPVISRSQLFNYWITAMRPIFISALLWILSLAPDVAHGADVRADFLKLIDRPRVPLAVEITAQPGTGPLKEFHFTFAADAQQRVPGIFIKKTAADNEANHRRPVVIALHGTGGSKADELPLLRKLAETGFIAVAIDGRYHGERTKAGKGTVEYQDAILRAWREQHEHPFYYDTVWDVMRLIDYLETREDVDKSRIGIYGVSKGGIETYLTAAVDPRVAVAVPCLGLQCFHWAVENNAWQSRIGTIQNAFDNAVKEAGVASPDGDFVHQFYARVAPEIDGVFDGPAMAPLIAPRPLLTIHGDSDARTPLAGLKLCTDAAGSAYRAAGADDHFVVRIQENTGHKVNPDSQAAAIDWFVKWLKP
jgi:dienelactone hydrolase